MKISCQEASYLEFAVRYVDARRHNGLGIVEAFPDVDAYLAVLDIPLDI